MSQKNDNKHKFNLVNIIEIHESVIGLLAHIISITLIIQLKIGDPH